MKVFGIPVQAFGAPFNAVWKRLAMHAIIASVVGLCWMFVYGSYFIVFIKFALFTFISDVAQSFIHILIHYKLQEKYDWIHQTRKRILWGILYHLTGTYILYFSVHLFCIHYFFDLTLQESFHALLSVWVLPMILVVFGMVAAIATEFFKNWKTSLVAAEKFQSQMMGYKYESLRNQINPHFLLDSFDVLKKLIRTDQHKAVTFVQMISNLYRHVLEVKDKEFISLGDELEYIETYRSLVQFRYGNQLELIIDVEANDNELIIPLALQSIIENAIENTLELSLDAVIIRVVRTDDYIEISNSKQQRPAMINAGTKNIEQQYQFYSKKQIVVSETESFFSVRIPVLIQG